MLFVVAVPLCEQSLSESRPSIRARQRTPVINRYNGKGGGGGGGCVGRQRGEEEIKQGMGCVKWDGEEGMFEGES